MPQKATIIFRNTLRNFCLCLNLSESRSSKRFVSAVNAIRGNGDTLFTAFHVLESSASCKNSPSVDDSLIACYVVKFCWQSILIYDLPLANNRIRIDHIA